MKPKYYINRLEVTQRDFVIGMSLLKMNVNIGDLLAIGEDVIITILDTTFTIHNSDTNSNSNSNSNSTSAGKEVKLLVDNNPVDPYQFYASLAFVHRRIGTPVEAFADFCRDTAEVIMSGGELMFSVDGTLFEATYSDKGRDEDEKAS